MKAGSRAVIIWPSSVHLLNNGDAAMLQVTVRRLQRYLPDHQVLVFAENLPLLERLCPGAVQLDPSYINLGWCRWRFAARALTSFPRPVQQTFSSFGVWLRVLIDPLQRKEIAATLDLLTRTDAVVSTGGGFLNDSFPDEALRILENLSAVTDRGIPAAMFGQGLGPVTNSAVINKAKLVFPRLSFVGLREGRRGLPLATQWSGGPSAQIRVTGDDAIEPAYQARPDTLGDAVGVNLRLAAYSGFGDETANSLTSAIGAVLQRFAAPTVPIVISRHPKDSDVRTIRMILGDHELLASEENYDTPEKTAAAVSRCRTVVTGSYHAGVFALSQGIPIVGLTRSAYYDDKFLGLQHQFGDGVEIVALDSPELPQQLLAALQKNWARAEDLRPNLLAAAERQIALSDALYRDFARLCSRR